MVHEQADDVGEGDAARLDAGLLMRQRRAEHALQRPHQPAFDAVRIVADGAAAERGAVVLEVEENGGGQGDVVALQRHQPRAAVLDHADGGIGSAEVYAAESRSHRDALDV